MLKSAIVVILTAAIPCLVSATPAFAQSVSIAVYGGGMLVDDQSDIMSDDDVVAVAEPVAVPVAYVTVNDAVATPYGYRPYYEGGYYVGYGYSPGYAYNPYYAAVINIGPGGRVGGALMIQAGYGAYPAAYPVVQPYVVAPPPYVVAPPPPYAYAAYPYYYMRRGEREWEGYHHGDDGGD